MSFNIGLSGIQAASSGLNVTGNNIANAGTVGFKQSRAEFADVYAASVLGSGSNPQGSGVCFSDVSQMFKQGNIDSTNSVLDLAINGNGFFRHQQQRGDQLHPRRLLQYRQAGFHRRQQRLPPAGLCRRAERPVAERRGHRPQGRARQPGAAGHLEHPAVVQPQLDAEAADRDAVRSVRRRYLQLVLFAGHL